MKNILYNSNTLEPSEELAPAIRISPFSSRYLYRANASSVQLAKCNAYLRERFGRFFIQPKARTCIETVLDFYHLRPDDVVTILTSSGNFYISGCVTKTIEKFCKWSREVTPDTKVIFINHEFGYPYKNWDYALSFNLPIIEDCAYAFFTSDNNVGNYGDFVIYSLPKAFPMQMGAILKANVDCSFYEDANVKNYVLNSLAQEIETIPTIVSKRKSNISIYLERLSSVGIKLFFSNINEDVVPGVFLFSWNETINFPELKSFMQSNGVECSCFYGEPAFFVPAHQNLSDNELSFICDLIVFFSKYK